MYLVKGEGKVFLCLMSDEVKSIKEFWREVRKHIDAPEPEHEERLKKFEELLDEADRIQGNAMSEQGHILLNAIMSEIARAGCSNEEKEKVLDAAKAAVNGDHSKVMTLIQEGMASMIAPIV